MLPGWTQGPLLESSEGGPHCGSLSGQREVGRVPGLAIEVQ